MTFKLASDATGGRLLDETGIAMQVTNGIVTFPAGVVKQSQTKRSIFSVFASANTPITTSVYTKAAMAGKVFDPANAFSTANSRYQPLTAGWYQINATCTVGLGPQSSIAKAAIYRNGTLYRALGGLTLVTTNQVLATFGGAFSIYFNGTTDYVEIWAVTEIASTTVAGDAGGTLTHMSGFLIEAD